MIRNGYLKKIPTLDMWFESWVRHVGLSAELSDFEVKIGDFFNFPKTKLKVMKNATFSTAIHPLNGLNHWIECLVIFVLV